MIKVEEIIKQFEFKITIVFACIVLFLVFFSGLINHVDIGTIIKRIIISEIFFIPMGFFIAHILKVYVFNNQKIEYLQRASEFQGNNIKEGHQEERINDAAVDKSDIEISKEAERTSIESEDFNMDTSKENNVIIKSTEDKDIGEIDSIPLDTPVSQGSAMQKELQKLNELSKDSLGKHIIINNKKIINDPKIMAEAVRTMMNKDE